MDDAKLAQEWRAIHCIRLTRSGHCAVAPTTQDIIALIARVREDEQNIRIEEACEVLRKHGFATGHGESVADVVEQAVWQLKEKAGSYEKLLDAALMTCCDLRAIVENKSHADNSPLSMRDCRSMAAGSWACLDAAIRSRHVD